MNLDLGIEEADVQRGRLCVNCGEHYSIAEYLSSSPEYFQPKYDYRDGCVTHCLKCWLLSDPEPELSDPEGNVLRDCGVWLSPEVHLAVMPIARVTLYGSAEFPGHTIFYPAGVIDLASLNIVPNDQKARTIAELASAMSAVDEELISLHPTIAFPVRFNWDNLWRSSHRSRMEFLRMLSEMVDDNCLNVIRYRLCPIEPIDALPARAGQVDSDHMMAGVVLYNAARQEGRIIAGDAFTHFITRGAGLPIGPLERDAFPNDGEVGHVVRHALSLYTTMLEANNPTAKFIQALALLEFLADPLDFRKFDEVKKIIARYIAQTPDEYKRLLDRFFELTGKRDPASQQIIGYRTRIIHIGERLDQIIRDSDDRRKLFEELDSYIRPVIDHMIEHSELTYGEYLEVRSQLRPFEN